jgi:hypothetical protein
MLLLALMGDPVPKFSADAFCRGVAKLLHEPEYRQECLKRENEAHDQLRASWFTFPLADRSRCVSLSSLGSTPSYVELLICLEIEKEIRERDAREHGSASRAD